MMPANLAEGLYFLKMKLKINKISPVIVKMTIEMPKVEEYLKSDIILFITLDNMSVFH